MSEENEISEVEYKMESITNSQFKFSMVGDPDSMASKIIEICSLISIKTGRPKKEKIVDIYLDDENRTLLKNDCSMRLRIRNGDKFITMKAPKDGGSSSAKIRFEQEISCTDEKYQEYKQMKYKGFNKYIDDYFLGKFKKSLTVGNIEEVVLVNNDRISIAIETEIAKYSFSFDKFYFEDFTSQDYSQYFVEMEIELEGEVLGKDEKLEKLLDALSMILDYQIHKSSKYESGINWLDNKEELKTVYTVMVDIVGYSLRTGDVQKKLIQRLNKLTKETLNELQMDISEIIYIPTGDGMIMTFKDKPMHLLPFIFRLQDKIKKSNKIYPMSSFNIRTGIHFGPVFIYSDINDNSNFAGSGINMAQRVMGIGDSWHILATQDAYTNIADMDAGQKPLFHKLIKKYPIKHHKEIVVYNVYDNGEGHGKRTDP